MNKSEVEQILILIKLGQEEALNMKVYKNGILTRHGCGGVPEPKISALSYTGKSDVFDKLMAQVPQEMLDNPVMYEDERIGLPLEYVIAFYGVSTNGDTGERAQWSKSTGVRFLMDSNSSYRHPYLGLIDKLAMDAAELTNSWYFDVIVNVAYDLKSFTLPDQTMISCPPTPEERRKGFENYVNQMGTSSRKWDLLALGNGKTYTAKDGSLLKADFSKSGNSINFSFSPVQAGPATDDKKWWKFW